MVSTLDFKLLRDLWNLKAQVLSIAVLIAAGVAVFVMSVSNYLALVAAQDTHYRNERFAELFAGVKRAPLTVVQRIREIDGIGVVEARIVEPVRVERPDAEVSISGHIVSIPRYGQPLLNRLYLVDGRWIDPAHSNEVIVNAAFAKARAVRPGDRITVILNGRLQDFRVAGIALSPEFVLAAREGIPLPDDRNLVVLWANEDAVASAFDMRGGFNDLLVTLAPLASKPAVIAEIDNILAPYGGTGAYERRDQASHRFLEDELAEQETLAIMTPAIFFGIAAFLLNVVLGRLIEAQREQIASLKALGYPAGPIALHYLKFASAVALAGSAIGIALGIWMASRVIETYRPFFRFPVLEPHLEPWVFAVAIGVSLGAANASVLTGVFRVLLLAPAEAMRPPVPAVFSQSLLQLFRGGEWVQAQTLVALRGVLGRPVRALLTVLGIALSVPLVLMGLFWFDALAYMIEVNFSRIERGDALLTFSDPVRERAIQELRHIPGVLLAEGQRVVPVRLRAAYRSYRTSITGLPVPSELTVPRDAELRAIAVPLEGLLMSRRLAKRLGIGVGDRITVDVLEGKRPVRELSVTALSDDILGMTATMELRALNRFMREGDVINAASLKVDPLRAAYVWKALQLFPKVQATGVKASWLRAFNETVAGLVATGAFILAGFGILIAVGVVYNSARVAFQERAWELASLRILGYTAFEVSAILLTELAVELLLALPIGLLLGRSFVQFLISAKASESFDVPAIIEPSSYAIAALVIMGAALATALLVRRKVDKLDLVAVLKTRD
jgi:putative ABC transport system permease protein